jgi:hypothetical protein
MAKNKVFIGYDYDNDEAAKDRARSIEGVRAVKDDLRIETAKR